MRPEWAWAVAPGVAGVVELLGQHIRRVGTHHSDLSGLPNGDAAVRSEVLPEELDDRFGGDLVESRRAETTRTMLLGEHTRDARRAGVLHGGAVRVGQVDPGGESLVDRRPERLVDQSTKFADLEWFGDERRRCELGDLAISDVGRCGRHDDDGHVDGRFFVPERVQQCAPVTVWQEQIEQDQRRGL